MAKRTRNDEIANKWTAWSSAAEKLLKLQTASNWGISPLCTYIVACPYRNWPLYMQELTVALSLRWLMAWTWSPLDSSWGHVKKSGNFKWFPSKSSKEWHTGEHYRTLIYVNQCYYLLWFPMFYFLCLARGKGVRCHQRPEHRECCAGPGA